MGADASRLRAGLQVYAGHVTREWGSEMAEAMRPEAPISTPTPTSTRAPGELRKSIRLDRVRPGATRFRARLVAPVIQAATTDKGAAPHVIRPRRAGKLRFWWNGPQGAKVYYFRKVNHPGNAAQNWWEPGLRRHAHRTLARAARRVRF